MARMLILVRHGKAEPAAAAPTDRERALTPEGRAALAGANGFPRTFSLLDDAQRAEAVLWASSARRAQETAQEVARVIGERPIEDHGSLWEQSGGAFLHELHESSAPCVVAVGHIPFMNEMVAYLTGTAVNFKPGAASALELDDTLAQGASRLMWFVQGPRA